MNKKKKKKPYFLSSHTKNYKNGPLVVTLTSGQLCRVDVTNNARTGGLSFSIR